MSIDRFCGIFHRRTFIGQQVKINVGLSGVWVSMVRIKWC